MTRKLYIVESPNDAAFVRLLLRHLSVADADAQTIDATEVEHLHNFTGTDGKEKRGKDSLPEKLKMLERDLGKNYPQIEHIGIILDLDTPTLNTDGGKERSLDLINRAIKSAFGYDPAFTEVGQNHDATVLVDHQNVSLRFSCYLMLEGTRFVHLDEVLKAIAKQPCPTADCLADMNTCVVVKTGEPMKDFDKQWVNHYVRCFASKKQIKNAERRLHEVISEQGADLFDLNALLIDGLKNYLTGATRQVSGT
ncbi:MAG: DUF3226 domain-containing protein [Saprospiraceae bacterium]